MVKGVTVCRHSVFDSLRSLANILYVTCSACDQINDVLGRAVKIGRFTGEEVIVCGTTPNNTFEIHFRVYHASGSSTRVSLIIRRISDKKVMTSITVM